METIKEVFQKIARNNPSYELREPQLDMAHLIEKCITKEQHALIEAGTGTGKSLAILIPAILSKPPVSPKPVVISTGTIALQEQYVNKDLPFLKSLGLNFTFALAKGKSNFICPLRLEKYNEQQEEDNVAHGDDFKSNPHLHYIWQEVNVDDSCSRKYCPYEEECPYYSAKEKWNTANIIVANHNLVLKDLAIKEASSGHARVIPEPSTYIFDEGHHIENIARNSLGDRISNTTLRYTLINITNVAKFVDLSKISGAILANNNFFQYLYDLMDKEEHRTNFIIDQNNKTTIIEKAIVLRDRYKAIIDSVKQSSHALSSQDKIRTENLCNRIKDHFETINTFLKQDDPTLVYWMEKHNKQQLFITLHTTPIDIAPILQNTLFTRYPTIITSATLGGDFQYLEKQLGLHNSNKMKLPPIFDYKKNSILYVPNIPSPKDAKYLTHATEEMTKLLHSSKGKALLLFTSWRVMKQMYETLHTLPYPMKKQDDMDRFELIEWFKQTPNSVLLATQTFWEGVDVPGDNLKLVIIDKIPFSVPDDPITKAIYKHCDRNGGNSFMEISVPIAITKLKQGFGRLIRTKQDNGVVAILDSRLISSFYGKRIINALPPALRTRKFEAIESFFNRNIVN